MNTNLFQTILTTVGIVLAGITTILLSMGCTTLATGALSCATTSAPTWLAPYLITIVAIINIVKVIISAIGGKLAAPTAVINNSGAAGTVTPAQVASTSK